MKMIPTNQTYQSALRYINEMIELNGMNYKFIRTKILQNIVNSEYGRNSNLYIEYVWQILNEKFKS